MPAKKQNGAVAKDGVQIVLEPKKSQCSPIVKDAIRVDPQLFLNRKNVKEAVPTMIKQSDPAPQKDTDSKKEAKKHAGSNRSEEPQVYFFPFFT